VKVSSTDSDGTLFVGEIVHQHRQGGPPSHLHREQDEWFYVLEGDYVVVVGQEQFRLGPGDSAFGPRGVPHVWAFAGDGAGRMVVVITPAGQMDPFFRRLSAMGAAAPQDPAFWSLYGMELVGPPLAIPSLVNRQNHHGTRDH
jgi:mannose-6-phosphate isomerase-like protein (cupin superfamily)